nr:ARMT1-like domain-containing protein [uncultured Desulfobulbus sp.]
MHTGNDCLVCFMRQVLGTVRRCTDDTSLQWQLLTTVGGMLQDFEPHLSPPENAVHYYRLISTRTGVRDPFLAEKQESNAFALDLEARTRELIAREDDPLLAALSFSINANVLDYGSQVLLDREKALADCRQELAINHYQQLLLCIENRGNILYLADNCGEIVFDKLVIELLQVRGCKVTLAVRKSPIINDATPEDATTCGLDQLCPVIDNGADIPGTALSACSASFIEQFQEADLIISKGMGNFECLSEVEAPIFFLFMIKCTSVLQYLQPNFPGVDLSIGSPILLQGSRIANR